VASATTVNYSEPSLAKQVVLTKYAKGEITRQELAKEIAHIRPPAPKMPWGQWIVFTLTTILVSALVPPQAKRD
jgi:hypothetical protein